MYGGVKTYEFGIALSIRNILKKYTLNHGDWKINSTTDYGDGFDLRNVTALWCINQIIHSNDINKENDEELMGMKTKFGEQGVSKPVTTEILNIILDDLIARFDTLVIPERMAKYGVDKPKVLEQINSIKGEIGIFDNIDISEAAYTEKDAVIANSDFLNGLEAKVAMQKAIEAIEAKEIGKGKVTVQKTITIPYTDIKEAVVIISF